jgi:hypothetical protein
VHQFYAKEGPDEGAIAQYLMTAIGKYLDEMGVSRKLLDWASTVDSDSIQVIPYGMVVNFNLDNTRPHAAAWTLVGMDAESGAAAESAMGALFRFRTDMQLALGNTQKQLTPLKRGRHALQAITKYGKNGGSSVTAYAVIVM